MSMGCAKSFVMQSWIVCFEFIYRNMVVLPLFQSDSKEKKQLMAAALTAEQRELLCTAV